MFLLVLFSISLHINWVEETSRTLFYFFWPDDIAVSSGFLVFAMSVLSSELLCVFLDVFLCHRLFVFSGLYIMLSVSVMDIIVAVFHLYPDRGGYGYPFQNFGQGTVDVQTSVDIQVFHIVVANDGGAVVVLQF